MSRCTSMTRSGAQCRRQARRGDRFCTQHSKRHRGSTARTETRRRRRGGAVSSDDTSLLMSVYDILENNASSQVLDALTLYTTADGYRTSNSLAHTNSRQITPTFELMQRHVVAIDRAFELVPPLPRSMTVYRGMYLDQEQSRVFLQHLELNLRSFERPCETLIGRGFVSSTLDPDVAKYFHSGGECCIMEIELRRGTRVVPLWPVSREPHEREVLLHRRQLFRLRGIGSLETRDGTVPLYQFVTC